MKTTLLLGATTALSLALFTPAQSSTVTSCLGTQVDLIAAQFEEVGSVCVTDNGEDATILITTFGTWKIGEAHVDIGDDLSGIPRTRNGQPQIGRFACKEENIVPPEMSVEITCPLPDTILDDTVVVAVHAVVVDLGTEQTVSVLSGETDGTGLLTTVTRRRAGIDQDFTDVDVPAVPAWIHPIWASTLDGVSPRSDGADFIWEPGTASDQPGRDFVNDPVVGTVITLERIFELDGFPIGGTLEITCDNGYAASLNGSTVVSAQVPGGNDAPGTGGDTVFCSTPWQLSDLGEECVSSRGWQTVETRTVGPQLLSGENTLTVDAGNERFVQGEDGDITTGVSAHGADGTVNSNPGMCIFALHADFADAETAWGEGTEFNPDSGWAMWFTHGLSG